MDLYKNLILKNEIEAKDDREIIYKHYIEINELSSGKNLFELLIE